MHLHTIIYVSSATEIYPLEKARVNLEEGRKLNLQKGVTGLLVFAQGNVLVLLEGERDKVLEVYRHGMSKGHHNYIKIYDKPAAFRIFEDYPLAVKPINIEGWKPLDDFSTPEQTEFFNECLNSGEPCMNVVRDFLKNNS